MNSLRERILASAILGLVIALLVSGVGIYLIARRDLLAQSDVLLLDRLRTFSSIVIEDWPDAENPERPHQAHLDYDGPLDEAHLGVLVRVTTRDGAIVAVSPDWPDQDWPARAAPALNAGPVLTGTARSQGERWRAACIRVVAIREEDAVLPPEAAATTPPEVVVEVVASLESVDETLGVLLSALVVGGALAVGGTSLAVWLGVVRGLRPLSRLRDEMDRMKADTPTALSAAERYPLELRPIVGALRALLGRVSASMERERRFTDAAAHELRTPIAELRALTDVADRWPEPERLRRTIVESRGVADEMASLIESLLAVARGSKAFVSEGEGAIALLPLARGVLESRRAAGGAIGVGVVIEGDDAAGWTGPRGAILAIVRNLVENALEYTPDGGSVRVSVRSQDGGVRFEAENQPVNLTPEQTAKLFEPFWRADASGSDRTHRGLGLAIVASLAESLGLRHEATLPREGVLRIAVWSG